MSLNKNRIILTVCINVVIILGLIITLVIYITTNSKINRNHYINMMKQTTENSSETSKLFFESQREFLVDRKEYSLNENLDEYDVFKTYILETIAESGRTFQLINVNDLTGVSLSVDNNEETLNYSSNESSLIIKEACDVVINKTFKDSDINITGAFIDPSNGILSNGVYTIVDLKSSGVTNTYLFMSVTEISSFIDKINPISPYENVEGVIVDNYGNYVITSSTFEGTNIYENLIDISNTNYKTEEELRNRVLESGTGYFYSKNSEKKECLFSYKKIEGTNELYYFTSVPNSSLKGIDYNIYFLLIFIIFLIILVVYDGTSAKILINRLRKSLKDTLLAEEKIQKTLDSKNVFLANMSHEIRTPLNAIIGLNDLARDNVDNVEELRSYLNDIDLSSKHLLSLINDVLDMNMVGQSNFKLHNSVFDLKKMIEVIYSIYKENAREKKRNFDITIDGRIDYWVLGDELRIRQVIVNLISNAIKYNYDGGFVNLNIKTKEHRDSLEIYFEVVDNGIGMKQEMLKHIFNEFERIYNDQTKEIAGSGLGLAISHRLVELMRGELSVESVYKKGSKFFFTLDLPIKMPIEEKKEFINLCGKKVLVADDKNINQLVVKKNLETVKIDYVITDNGLECLERFKESKEFEYFAILLDIRMPILDGLETAKKIRALDRKDAKEIIIVATSANAFEEDVNASLASGMNAHFSKPIDFKKLFALLREWEDENNEKKKNSNS